MKAQAEGLCLAQGHADIAIVGKRQGLGIYLLFKYLWSSFVGHAHQKETTVAGD